MITYEYECQQCGHKFEAEQHMVDKPLTKCPQCKGRIERLIGGGIGVLVKSAGPPCAASGPVPSCCSGGRMCQGNSPACEYADR